MTAWDRYREGICRGKVSAIATVWLIKFGERIGSNTKTALHSIWYVDANFVDILLRDLVTSLDKESLRRRIHAKAKCYN